MGKRKTTFEEALRQLETIAERIEKGEIGLEESITQYEKGMALVQHSSSSFPSMTGPFSTRTAVRLSVDANRGEAIIPRKTSAANVFFGVMIVCPLELGSKIRRPIIVKVKMKCNREVPVLPGFYRILEPWTEIDDRTTSLNGRIRGLIEKK